MSKKILLTLFTTSAIVGLPTSAAAQSGGDVATDSGEIIVTARREAESLQDVPVSIQVVSGETLQKQAITSVEEVSKLAPGLTLVNAGSNTSVTLRGVTWQPGSGTPATPIYLNEVPFDPANTIVSLYDVGQIEVLRGPQGTTRGAPSISGAITISTRKPDLEQFGGYVQGQYGTADHWDVQGAVNVPIIKDVLAVRLAANIEESEGTRIYSVNSNIQPKYRDRSYRATVLFKPTDTLSLQAMYQRRRTLKQSFAQVAGTGSPGLAALGIPANFNGPALTSADRASVSDLPSYDDQHIDLLTANASWEVFGHTLSYNFGRQFNRSPAVLNSNDPLNILPGFEAFTSPSNIGLPKFTTHEIRLSSLPHENRPFEYDIGWFSKHSGGAGINFFAPVYLPGAFGAPFQARPGQVTTPDPRYVLNSSTNIRIGQVFDSFYGNVRAHLGERTELTAGLAIVRDRVPVRLDVTTTAAQVAFARFLPAAAGGCPSPLLPNSPVYGAGYCEVTQPASVFPSEIHNDKYTDALYNLSLSHKFSDAVLVYATTGSSFRTGLPAINNTGLPANLLVPEPETAKSYELGVKTTFGRGLRINAAVFQLDYKNQLTTFEGVSYFNAVTARVAQTSLAFYRNIDARVRGFELEVAARPIENLSIGANVSYSQIKSKGGLVPCNDPTKPITSANPINFCASPEGQVLNTQAPFQATVNGSYEIPFTENFGGYFRFNVNYQGKNPNFGNFRKADGTFTKTDAYAVVDLFAGIAGKEGAWDLGVYAKNVFDKQVELARVLTTNSIYPLFAAPAGYDVVRSSRPREIGVTLRYAFGSR
ncbi:MAG: TonB-dependent receptor [Rhizobiaceae bacterium]|nr:MAG: TonB-dependent receptor [Rhizobiaceae bacterium]